MSDDHEHPKHVLGDEHRKQTQILSWEFLLTLVVQVAVVPWFISESQASQNVLIENHDNRISNIEKNSVTREEFARLDQKMTTMIENQAELKAIVQQLQERYRR